MNADILRKLVCPNCGSPSLSNKTLSETGSDNEGTAKEVLECSACGSFYPCHDEIIDLSGSAITAPRKFSSQWAMEFQPLVAFYEHVWRPMVTKPFSDFDWEKNMVQRLIEAAPGMDILDLGCGPGNFTRLFARLVKSGVVVGFDLSLPMLKQGLRELHRENISNVVLMRGDVTRWPFAKASFDRVHCAGALHLFPKLIQVFSSIYSTLKPGGVFVGATYCRGDGFVKRRIQEYVSAAHGFHWFELQELQNLAEESGLSEWQHFMKKQGIVFRVRKPALAA